MIFNTTSAGKPEQTKTATPSLSQQTISPDSGKVLSGVIINPITAALLTSLDPDFKAANIAKDANLFGLVGTHEGRGEMVYATGTGKTVYGVNTVNGLAFKPVAVSFFHTNGAHWGTCYAVDGNIKARMDSSVASELSVGDGYFSFKFNTSSAYDFKWHAIGVKN